jgi:hypothetical protein
LASIALVAIFVSIVQIGLILTGDLAFSFTLGAWRAFFLHTPHHFHQALEGVRDIHPLIDDLPHPRF